MSTNMKSETELKKEHLLLLFEHPFEPVFMAKGRGEERYIFSIPSKYEVQDFTAVKQREYTRLQSQNVVNLRIPEIDIPEFKAAKRVERLGFFSTFLTDHQESAAELIKIFIGAQTIEKLIAYAACIRDQVNPYLFHHALAVAILHRKDTQTLKLPAPIFTFPGKFIEGKALAEAVSENVLKTETNRVPIEVIPLDWTGTDVDEEHRVAYFREDFGVNIHHFHWHLVYPTAPIEAISQSDRRGELFYYMHRQFLARYNFERLCNRMKRAESFNHWREPIKEAYYSKLNNPAASRRYPGRSDNNKLGNLFRDSGLRLDVNDLEMWLRRIYAAIQDGKVVNDKNEPIELTVEKGIDILGNLVESSELSPNRRFYGDIHNKGHLFISLTHDPDDRYQEPMGVMSETTTAVRDPIFFRWHTFVDDIFQDYKATLPPYTPSQLNYPGISVTDLEVQTQTDQGTNCKKNVLYTYLRKADVDISGGLDFLKYPGTCRVRFTHLDHLPFTYKITVRNSADREKLGTCRVFLAPRFNETASKQWEMIDQRKFFIELDKFKVTLPQGKTVIRRKSSDSTVTIPFERTFAPFEPNDDPSCSCGWPEYLLIPKGRTTEMPCTLFVMVSNYDDDKVEDSKRSNASEEKCDEGSSYCGLAGEPYPDRRAMGYPFDRDPPNDVVDIYDFMNQTVPPKINNEDVAGNMRVTAVDIVQIDKTVNPKEPAPTPPCL